MSEQAINDGGQAFPKAEEEWDSCDERYIIKYKGGMTLRDWFAGQAMAGLCVGASGAIGRSNEFTVYANGPCNSDIAERAYLVADAMIAEGAKS